MRTNGHVSIDIAADPLSVYGLVADVTRIGEFSPECHTAEWQPGSGAAVAGATFRGHNKASWIRWSRRCEILTAEPGHELSFRTIPTWLKRDSTVWTYRIEARPTGSQVTESYDVVTLPPRPILAAIRRILPHHLDMRPHMQRTLEALKHTAETTRHDHEPNTARRTTSPEPAPEALT